MPLPCLSLALIIVRFPSDITSWPSSPQSTTDGKGKIVDSR